MAIKFKDFGNKLKNTEERSRAKLVEAAIQPTPERELFFKSNVFSVGKTVLFEEKRYEIIDKRSNHVVIISESGEMQNKFPTDLIPTNQSITFKDGTYKGIEIPTGFEKILENSSPKDPVGVIKSMDNFKNKNFRPLFENAEKIGLDLESIYEATRSDQIQAISIVAEAMGIKLHQTDPQKQVEELIKNSKKLTPSQHKIFKDMLGMLSKLGLKITDNLKESIQKHMLVKTSDEGFNREQVMSPELEDELGVKLISKGRTLGKVGSMLHSEYHGRLSRVKKLNGDL